MMAHTPLAIVVMSRERRRPLLSELQSLKVEILAVGSCQEARALLQTQPPVDLVITQVSLPDGNWCDIFKFLVDTGIETNVVVSSPRVDEILWSEVLWRGAYDLLVEPFESDEVRRSVEGALRAAHTSGLTTMTQSAAVGKA